MPFCQLSGKQNLCRFDLLLQRIEDEIEESGEASKEAMDRLQLFCQAMNVKVDRIGRYLSVMETRAEHCKQEAARYAQRAKRAQSKIDRTKAMVLYYLESHDLKQVESDDAVGQEGEAVSRLKA
jgi:hypothetical protein